MPAINIDYEHQRRARTSVLFYLILTIATMLAAAGFLVDPAKQNPAWVHYTVGGMGVFFVIYALYAIARDFSYGSRVERKLGLLIWWEGYPPVEENVIPVSSLNPYSQTLTQKIAHFSFLIRKEIVYTCLIGAYPHHIINGPIP